MSTLWRRDWTWWWCEWWVCMSILRGWVRMEYATTNARSALWSSTSQHDAIHGRFEIMFPTICRIQRPSQPLWILVLQPEFLHRSNGPAHPDICFFVCSECSCRVSEFPELCVVPRLLLTIARGISATIARSWQVWLDVLPWVDSNCGRHFASRLVCIRWTTLWQRIRRRSNQHPLIGKDSQAFKFSNGIQNHERPHRTLWRQPSLRTWVSRFHFHTAEYDT